MRCEKVNTKRDQQQLTHMNRSLLEKSAEYRGRQHNVIFLHAPSHAAKPVRGVWAALCWEVLPHAVYWPDLTSSDYHMYLQTCWAALWFIWIWKKGSMNGSIFYWRSINKLPKEVWSILWVKHFWAFFRIYRGFFGTNRHFILVHWYFSFVSQFQPSVSKRDIVCHFSFEKLC